ncbi:hypothetical protein [Thiohalorhabdus methylotrophus]|uniref:DUF4352 domain-containing protein n=1 Tax=Thiohalorhabdus methylotrophus TaxID=3242694 RepID=A0ABV4TTC5_9GAMM
MLRVASLALATLLALAGCASHSYEVVRIPKRDADVYPTSRTRQGVSVAVDTIGQGRRARRYFGVALPEAGILPVNITVSNHGERGIRVRPADFLLHEYGRVVDPVPVDRVAGVIETEYGVKRRKTAERIHTYLGEIHFSERVIAPGATYQGVLFFDIGKPPDREERFAEIRILHAFRVSGYRLRFKVTRVESRKRVGFTPFTLRGLPDL